MQAISKRGLISTPLPAASQVGLDILDRGGTAIDAALAASAVLCVAYPHMTGLGGDAFWLIADSNGDTQTICGVGHCAANVTLAEKDASLPMRGVGSVITTAGAPASWANAFSLSRQRWHSPLTWPSLLEPAWHCAAKGFEVSHAQAFWHREHRDILCAQPGFARVFEPEGRVPETGETLCLPELAESLQLLIDEGADSFYRGRLATRLQQGFSDLDIPIDMQDLRTTRAENGLPLRLPYRGGEALNLAPPAQGLTSLQILGQLAQFDLHSNNAGSVEHFHLMVEAVKGAFADRNRYLADPHTARIPIETLLGSDRLKTLAANIDRLGVQPWPYTTRSGDTVWLGAVDRQGRCVSLIQSVFTDFGSGVVVGDTGILWHNRGAAFCTDPAHPNVLAPGKRPAHTLNPAMYFQHGRPRFIYGTQGADGQPQTQTALITRAVDFGQSIEQAISAPRFLLGRSFFDTRETLKIESDAGESVIEGLRVLGHTVETVTPRNAMMGQAGLISIDGNGTAYGVHDPRGEGLALGL